VSELSVAVCACTYQRPDGLRAMLDGIAGQTFTITLKPALHVVIADNEGSDQARDICAEFQVRTRVPLTYVHEPQRGISYARNACLDHLPTDCDFFAFIDDDEVPAPDWLAQLLLAQHATNADVVQGRVVPTFDDGTPNWIARGDFFGRPRRSYDLELPEVEDLGETGYAGAGNALVRVAAVRQCSALRFDPDLAFSGGEDTLFFRTLRAQGYRIVFSSSAVVYEHVPPTRANFRYMCVERFRVANINALSEGKLSAQIAASRFASVRHGIWHIFMGFRRVFKTLLSKKRPKDRFAVGAFHAAYGLGIIAAAFGFKYQHYK
jgi:succinoglycan biosynthesis protein ExoM